MNEDLAWFNRLPRDEAERRLRECCGSRTWAASVAAGRPYDDFAALVTKSETVWRELGPTDWLEAFAAHPRLGESGGRSPDSSQKEQSRVMGAADETLAVLAAENRRYEARFGRVFLISAAGRSAEVVLATLRQRIENDPATELVVAAGEQSKITLRRLARMLHE